MGPLTGSCPLVSRKKLKKKAIKSLADVVSIKLGKCPMCGNRIDTICRPFCSKRCADLDLTSWFDEAYRIPTNETEPLNSDELDE